MEEVTMSDKLLSQLTTLVSEVKHLREDVQEIKEDMKGVKEMEFTISHPDVGLLERVKKIEKDVNDIKGYITKQKAYVAIITTLVILMWKLGAFLIGLLK